jgi:2-dehydropantoate 2-reductase
MNDGKQPTFAVMGSGGVGGYFGARLAQAGYPVTFIARGAHLRAIRDNGLTVEGPEDALHVTADATDSPAEIGPVDFVLFCVKLWDTEDAARACAPLIGPETAVVSLQNGVESEDMLAAVLGAQHVMGGVAEIAASITAPGLIHKLSPFHIIRFGELDGRPSARGARLERCLADAGIQTFYSDDIQADIWRKFIFLVGLSALTALTRMPIGPVRDNPDTRALFQQVMQETFAVARARGVALADDTVAQRMAFVDTLPPDMRASMAIDLSQGRRLELPWLSGAVVRLGAETDVDTPANGFIATALKLHVMGDPG